MTQPASAELTFVIPGDLSTRTGGYGYDRHIIAGLRAAGWQVTVARLDDSFPFPTAPARGHAASVLATIHDGGLALVDGLALGALPEEIARECRRLDIVALIHHPLAAETGLDPATASALEESERRALACVRAVVVTSRATADALADYGVGSDRITVVEPGTDRAPIARSTAIRDPQSAIRNLLCVATLTPRKGHEMLFAALASLRDRRWRLVCGGSLDRDRALVARLREQLVADAIADRVELVGDLDATALAVQYERADIFVLPTLYEGYGMAVAEALARGLPIVSTATGGIREMVTSAAGIIVAPGDRDAFTAALARVLDDDDLRARLAEGARRVRDLLPTWDDAIRSMVSVLVGGHRTPTPNSGTKLRHQTPAPNSGTELRHRTPALNSGTELRHRTPAPGFSAEWLALREPADNLARCDRLARMIADAFPPDAELHVLDLGAGTGANFRYLSPRLQSRQRWLLVDHDAALLARVPAGVETRVRDLVDLTDDGTGDLFVGRALVTSSALLDLVSSGWIQALASRCGAAGAAVLFALNYDGRIACTPTDPEDERIRELVNQHQRTDKGFGWAAGPDAIDFAAGALAGHGYRITCEPSDWVLTPESGDLQRQLIEGWARAAAEIAPASAASIDGWLRRRLAHLAAGRSHLVVGHEDLAGWPP